MTNSEKERDPIPEHFASLEVAAEFWDDHDLADYWDLTEEETFTVNLRARHYLVALDPALAEQLAAEARRRGISTETLTNLWLSQRLQQSAA